MNNATFASEHWGDRKDEGKSDRRWDFANWKSVMAAAQQLVHIKPHFNRKRLSMTWGSSSWHMGVRLVGIRGHWVELLTWITIRRASAAIEFLHQQILNKITNVIVVCFPAPPPLHLQIDLYHITISIEYNVPCFKINNWNKYKSKHHMSHCMQEGE